MMSSKDFWALLAEEFVAWHIRPLCPTGLPIRSAPPLDGGILRPRDRRRQRVRRSAKRVSLALHVIRLLWDHPRWTPPASRGRVKTRQLGERPRYGALLPSRSLIAQVAIEALSPARASRAGLHLGQALLQTLLEGVENSLAFGASRLLPQCGELGITSGWRGLGLGGTLASAHERHLLTFRPFTTGRRTDSSPDRRSTPWLTATRFRPRHPARSAPR